MVSISVVFVDLALASGFVKGSGIGKRPPTRTEGTRNRLLVGWEASLWLAGC